MSDGSGSALENAPRDRRRELEAILRKKAERSRSFPLSFVQERLWVLDQLDPGNPVYNVPLGIRIKGELDVPALTSTLNTMIARHETLRTRIAAPETQPLQIVEPAAARELVIVSLEDVPFERREAEAVARATAEIRRPFRLDQAPLFRISLLRLSADDHVLVIVLHHVISDDWSLGVLVREVILLYQGFRENRPSPLEPLPIQYADYAAWQRQHLEGPTLDRLLNYWQPQLAGVPPLELPADHARSLDGRQSGAIETLLVPLALLTRLREEARRQGATLYMILLAAYQVLLYRYSGQTDFAVGSPIAGRVAKETEGLVGCFVNTLALRAKLDPGATFRQLLAQVRQTALDAFAHQELPFERLVEALNPDRDPSRHPLFQAAFTLQSAPWPEVNIAGIRVAAMALDPGTSKFDLSFIAREQRDGLSLWAEYGSPLFERSTIARMLRHYQSILQEIVADLDRPIAQLPLLDNSERHQILVEWNNAPRVSLPAACIHHLIEAQVDETPDRVAVEFQGRQLTYRELDERANKLAHHLRALGVVPETLVGISVERSWEMVVALLAIQKAGGAYVPLDPAFPRERRAFMLADADVSIIVTQACLTADLPPTNTRLVCLDSDWDTISREPIARPMTAVAAEQLAYVLYTSGSTGKPKGVQITHRSLVNFLLSMRQQPGIDAQDTLLAVTTLSFDIAGLEIYLPLLVGARTVIVAKDAAQDGFQLIEELERSSASVMQATPATWRMLVQAGWAGRSQLKALCGGEALAPDLARELLDRTESLWNMYGPTETTIWSSVHRVTRNDKAIPLGRPIANTQFYIVDAHGQPVPIGVRGELCIGGDGLARGYLNRPALTAEKFVTSAFSEAPGATIYKTGDLARYLPDGNIQFLGRLDHQVKIRGFRIELGEIDAALLQHPGVRAAAVTALANGPGEKELAAYWVAADTIPTNDELRTFLRTLLPDYMVPSIFVKLDSLPLSPSGKTDYKALPAPERGRDERLAYVAPRTADEEWLAALWREILRTDQVGVHDNFFTMGGHSLLATQVVLRINRSLNLHIPVRDLFEAGTIERLAQKVAAARRAGTRNNLPPIEPAPRERPVPMAYNQEPFWVSSNLQQGPAPYAFHPVMRIKGPLDTQALEEALGLIVRRHEPLRTTFVDDGNQIVQRIAPYEPWKLRVVDLSRLSDEDRETEVSRYAKAESDRPLDLVEGPLFRLEVLKLSNHEHVILVGRHHIIYDGWSLEVLSRELLTAYLASTAGFEPPLPELPVQYADFAAWQRARLEGDVLAHLTDYWRTQLAGLPVLDLPTDRPRPAARTTAGAACERVLPSRVASAIREFGKNSEATTFMALMAAYQILLHLTSRQDDFAVSTPVAGRLRPETENLIGCFMNDLVIRANLAGDPTFRQVMERVKGTVLNALDHQEMPFALLIKKLNPHRDPGRRTLVQTELIVHNVAPSGPPLPGLELSDLRSLTATEGADFELCLEVFDEPSSMQLRLCYQTDLFDASTIERLLRHFEKVLEAATAHPDTPLSQLGLPARSSLPHHRTNGAAPIVTNIPKHDSAPRSEVEHALVKLWSRHLRLDALEVNDDFFAKGGHSLAAVRMMTQARELFGIDVPIATFFARPTIAALARSIENGLGAQSRPAATSGLTMGTNGRHPPAPGPRSLVRLRAGGAAIPLFCIHGLGGHVASFWPLARGLGEERPVYGLQGRGLEAAEEPHRRIEAMARAYRSEIQQAQPRGPYLLAGWSMGGLIAIEIARQITAQGDDLALVAMLDTGFSVHEVSRRDMEDQAVLDWIAPRLNVSAVELKQMPLDQQWKWIAARAKLSEGDGIAEIRRLANVCLAHLAALADYDPEPFSGETVLFQTGCEASIQPRWPDVCPALRVELVGGNHYTMLKPPYVEDLAERLDRYLCGRKPARATVGAKLP